MMEAADALLGALGLALKNVIAGAIGAFVSLRFFEGLGTGERWVTFVGGWALGAYLGAIVTAYLALPPKMEVGMSLGIALFGMAISSALVKVVRETDWAALLKRKTGG